MVESKTFGIWLCATFLLAAVTCGRPLKAQVIPTPQPIAPADYRICAGDVLEVWVYQHPELSRRMVVKGDGNHTLMVNGVRVAHPSKMDEILHDMKAAGMTVTDVAALLRSKLESIVAKPQVMVILVEFVMQPSPPAIRPSPQLQDTPSRSPLSKPAVHLTHDLRDVPSPEFRRIAV